MNKAGKRNLFKKNLSIIAILVLLLSSYTPVKAEENIFFEFNNYISAIIPYENNALILVGGDLWYWDVTLNQPQAVSVEKEDQFGYLALLGLCKGRDNKLLGIFETENEIKGYYCTLTNLALVREEAFTLDLGLKKVLKETRIINILFQEDILYIHINHPATAQKDIYAKNLMTNEEVYWENSLANSLIPYQNNFLLITQIGLEVGKNGLYPVVKVDVFMKKLEPLTEFDIYPYALTYCASDDELIFISKSFVYKTAGLLQTTPQGYIPVTTSDLLCGTLMNENLFLLAGEKKLYWVELNRNFAVPTTNTLTLAQSGVEQESIQNFREKYPHIMVKQQGEWLMAADVAHEIRTGNKKTDVFIIRTSDSGYFDLLAKGFWSDLSAEDDLVTFAKKLPHELYSSVVANNSLCALPIDFAFSGYMGLMYSPETLEAIGISMPLPNNVSDLLSLLISSYESGAMDGIRLFDSPNPEHQFVDFIIHHYLKYIGLSPDEDRAFADETITPLLEKTDKVLQLMKKSTSSADDSLPSLFMDGSPDYLFRANPEETDRVFLPLCPTKGMPYKFPVYATVAIVNPLSENKHLAVDYLSTIVSSLTSSMEMKLHPAYITPVEAEGYSDIKANTLLYIAELEKQLALLEKGAEEQKLIEETLEILHRDLQYIEANRWAITQEQINEYRFFAESIVVNNDNTSVFTDLPQKCDAIKNYVAGTITYLDLLNYLDQLYQNIKLEQP